MVILQVNRDRKHLRSQLRKAHVYPRNLNADQTASISNLTVSRRYGLSARRQWSLITDPSVCHMIETWERLNAFGVNTAYWHE